jgi:RimJ/RimL family protein N-acetyltransferase
MPYLIIDETIGMSIGFPDLKNIDWSIPKSEMGCYMDKDFAGKGVGLKAFQLFCDFCFSTFQFRKLFLCMDESNVEQYELLRPAVLNEKALSVAIIKLLHAI